MHVILEFKILKYSMILLQIAVLLTSVVCHPCEARKEQIGRYQVKIELINPSNLYFEGKELQIVILKKDANSIVCYEYGDPEKSIRLFNRGDSKLERVKRNFLEGYLLSDINGQIRILATIKVADKLLHKYGIQVKGHQLGKILTIPISEIKELKVLKKGRAGIGMAIGAGVGFGAASIATLAYDPDESSSLVTFDKGEAFVAYSILFVVPGTLIGGVIAAAKKNVQTVIINGNEEEYKRHRPKLVGYFIKLEGEINQDRDDFSSSINKP